MNSTHIFKLVLVTRALNNNQQELDENISSVLKLHPSSLTNMKKLTNNFCKSVQICWREKENVEKNVNCKAFCIIRKHNNATADHLWFFVNSYLTFPRPTLGNWQGDGLPHPNFNHSVLSSFEPMVATGLILRLAPKAMPSAWDLNKEPSNLKWMYCPFGILSPTDTSDWQITGDFFNCMSNT